MRKTIVVFLLIMFFFSINQQPIFAIQENFNHNEYLAITSQMSGNLTNVLANMNEMSRQYKLKNIRMLDNITIEYQVSDYQKIINKKINK